MQEEKAFSLNFNLRSGKVNNKRIIYGIIKTNIRQVKVSLGVKIHSQFWDKDKQECILSDAQSIEEANGMAHINQLIYAIRTCYAMNRRHPVKSIIQAMEDIISNGNNVQSSCKPKPRASAIALLNKAFLLQYGENKQEGKKENSTWKQYRRLLDEYFKYLRKKGIRDTAEDVLSQVALNNYRQYLIDEGLAASSINHKVGIVARLINRKLSMDNMFLRFQIPTVRYEQVRDSRLRSEGLRTALTDEEIISIKKARGLSETQREYRDIFLMQCYTSMRASDVRKIFTGDYREEDAEGKRVLIIRAQKSRKEDGYYTILVDHGIQELLDRYAGGFKAIDISVNNDVFQQNLNDSIRKTALKAGLIRIHSYYRSRGNSKEEHHDRLCDIITSHFARHTFISKKVREGYSTEEIKNMTAHTDDAMIDKVYKHLTDEDRANARIMADKRNRKRKT